MKIFMLFLALYMGAIAYFTSPNHRTIQMVNQTPTRICYTVENTLVCQVEPNDHSWKLKLNK